MFGVAAYEKTANSWIRRLDVLFLVRSRYLDIRGSTYLGKEVDTLTSNSRHWD